MFTLFKTHLFVRTTKRCGLVCVQKYSLLILMAAFACRWSHKRQYNAATARQFVASMLLLVAGALDAHGESTSASSSEVDFIHDVQPILANHCLLCHGPDQQEGGIRFDIRDQAVREGDSGSHPIVPGKPDESELLRRVTSKEDYERMPPEGDPLAKNQIDVLRRWISSGAEYRKHWAYERAGQPMLPAVNNRGWVRNEIDRFVLAELERRSIKPSPEADRYSLIRRLYIDLLGFPPSVYEVDVFINDRSSDAYERLVEQLLASPHFGERWGRHWLDKARYADSDGYEKDGNRPTAYRYRDWVIQAINEDLPFDRFTVEQLAGDLLPERGDSQLIATGFHRQTLTNREGGVDQEQFRVEACFDRVETTGAVWLGLTIGCARCHSHKYDQISHREYYELMAFFNNGDELDVEVATPSEEEAEYRKKKRSFDRRLTAAKSELNARGRQIESGQGAWEKSQLLGIENGSSDLTEHESAAILITPDNRDQKQRQLVNQAYLARDPAAAKLLARVEKLKKTAPERPVHRIMTIGERVKDRRESHILARGDFLQPSELVSPGGLTALHPLNPRDPDRGADRLDLAHWLVDPANPLTPRVAVNHIWSHLFGRGLVETANDFGVRGEKPSHPELLDWLSAEFINRGWSRKAMVKLIVLSATYRQSSRHRPELADLDPLNRLLYRQNRFRVEGELVRDLSLAASGLLCRKVGGPSVFPPLPPDIAALTYADSFKWTDSEGDDKYRRGMYTFFKRTAPHPNLTTFDCPDANTTCIVRGISNTPLMALTTLNNDTFVEAAQALARRVLENAEVDDESALLVRAFRLCVARPPSDVELVWLKELLKSSRDWYQHHQSEASQLAGQSQLSSTPTEEAAAWVATCRIILNLDEFLTRD